MKELSKTAAPSSSGCRCHGCAGSRSRNGLFCVPGARCTRAVAPSLLCEELCCHPGGRAWLGLSPSSLRGCCLGAVAPRFLASFHQSCVVAVQALVLPGPARLDLLTGDWPWGRASSLFSYHPPSSHGLSRLVVRVCLHNLKCVYVISWKYGITFLRNLSFLLR